jgi:hypothetical protein
MRTVVNWVPVLPTNWRVRRPVRARTLRDRYTGFSPATMGLR